MSSRHTHVCSLATLLLKHIEFLLLESVRLGELEVDFVGGQMFVGVGKSFKTAIHDISVKGVQEDLLVAGASDGDTHGAASDVGGGDDVIEDGGVHSLKSSAAGAHLALVTGG